jgi:molybdopterin converting factor subunit 1
MIAQILPNCIFVSMNYKIKSFGIAREILGGKEVWLEVSGNTVASLRQHLSQNYPKLDDLRSLFIAVNQKYADDRSELKESDEIALIPPVSGG